MDYPIDIELLEEKLNFDSTVDFPRGYMGLSSIGGKCRREMQYTHYWAYKKIIPKQLKRIFDTGHMSEIFMSNDLRSEGFHIESAQSEVIGFAGHWKGHDDGQASINSVKILLEYKTHNDKSFKDLVKNGVKKSKPGHRHQVNSYMGYNNLELCLYMAYNKNDSHYCLRWLHFCEDTFAEDRRTEREIILATDILPRIGNNSRSWYECKMCDASKVCFGDKPIERSCRSCDKVDVEEDGVWSCGLTELKLGEDEQKLACKEYALAPMFRD